MATTRRRNVRDKRDAMALLDELEDSGLELSAFCASRGVDGRSLNCWRKNLGESASPRPTSQGLRLVEVMGPAEVASAAYKICIDGVCIEVDDHFREATLVRLLRVAATC